LITAETVWDETIRDAANSAMPKQLRELFAFICVFGLLSDVSELFVRHKDNLLKDFAKGHGH